MQSQSAELKFRHSLPIRISRPVPEALMATEARESRGSRTHRKCAFWDRPRCPAQADRLANQRAGFEGEAWMEPGGGLFQAALSNMLPLARLSWIDLLRRNQKLESGHAMLNVERCLLLENRGYR
jgi:hypothetical protein